MARDEQLYRIRIGPDAPAARGASPEASFLVLLQGLQDEGLEFSVVEDRSSGYGAAPSDRHVAVDMAIGSRLDGSRQEVQAAVQRAVQRVMAVRQAAQATAPVIVEPRDNNSG